MTGTFKTVDLFAGPGGLAEGFSSLRDDAGARVFDIALSVEKEASAFATLRLRSFLRQFRQPPPEYYAYLARRITREELIACHSGEWAAAVAETRMLELGTKAATSELDPVIDHIRQTARDEAILIGGPPCQAYSLVGRARNRGIKGYDAAGDHRHFLYREYIRIIGRLNPVAFVMENVKGMLSSKVDGKAIFDLVLSDLRSAGGFPDSYMLVPLVANGQGRHGGHVIRSEDFGIPQNRHRVILLGIRADRATGAQAGVLSDHVLEPALRPATVSSVLSGMPKLRSGLSRVVDDPESWRSAVIDGYRAAAAACRVEGTWLNGVADELGRLARQLKVQHQLPPRSASRVTHAQDEELNQWLGDPHLTELPNHETRGHMNADLARYAFAAVFTQIFERSPKAEEYPHGLAPAHNNWETGKFADRFRVQRWNAPSSTITSHISKDGHYFIHPDPMQCRSLTVREAARLQTFPDNYFFEGNRTQQFVQVGNAVPPLLARRIAMVVRRLLTTS